MAEDTPDPITEPAEQPEHPCCAECAADKYARDEWS